jgi:hypothetical protein
MFALKFFDLCPALDRDLLQFPGGHEHQSTKVSRCNQWENGAEGDSRRHWRNRQRPKKRPGLLTKTRRLAARIPKINRALRPAASDMKILIISPCLTLGAKLARFDDQRLTGLLVALRKRRQQKATGRQEKQKKERMGAPGKPKICRKVAGLRL